MFLLLPVITSLRGIDLQQLPGYLADGEHKITMEMTIIGSLLRFGEWRRMATSVTTSSQRRNTQHRSLGSR